MFRFITARISHTNSIGIRKYSPAVAGKINGLVIGLYENDTPSEPKLSTLGEKINKGQCEKLLNVIRESGMTGRLNETRCFTNIHPDFHLVCVTGLGKECSDYNPNESIFEGMENVRKAAAAASRELDDRGCSSMSFDSMEFPEQVAEGSTLAVWNLNKLRKNKIPKVQLYEPQDSDSWMRGLFKADAQNFARKLTEMPSNLVTPTSFAQFTMDLLCPCGLTVEFRTMDWLKSHHFSAFLSVARSSCEPPVMLEMTYCGGEQGDPPVLLVGSGLTYNSGGLCLFDKVICGKDKLTLFEQRSAMAGAASIVAVMRAVANLQLPINVTGIVPLCENMPSGMAFKPGDIVTALNGSGIDVSDTSNAAVLLLADIISYGRKTYKPKLVVDVSAVSKGAVQAFGGAASCVFTNSTRYWNQINAAGSVTGDRVRRLPLWEHFTKMIKSKATGNINNTGSGTESACLAAACLKEFCKDIDWIHMDIEGVKLEHTEHLMPYLEKDCMTGRPTRTVIQFLYQLACPEAPIPRNATCD